MEGKLESFGVEMNITGTSLDFLKFSINCKRGNTVLYGKEDEEKPVPAAYQTISSELMKKSLARCTVKYSAKAY